MDIIPNNPINQSNAPIGFLFIITEIPNTEAIILNKSKNSTLCPSESEITNN
jgi:hypothetical protein